jgi:hypothetical protein
MFLSAVVTELGTHHKSQPANNETWLQVWNDPHNLVVRPCPTLIPFEHFLSSLILLVSLSYNEFQLKATVTTYGL